MQIYIKALERGMIFPYLLPHAACMSEAACVRHGNPFSCLRCISVAVITVKKGVMGDMQCEMTEEEDQSYITLFLFAVETANYFLRQNSTNQR